MLLVNAVFTFVVTLNLSYEKRIDDETLDHFSPGQVPKENAEKQLVGKLLKTNSGSSSRKLEGTKQWTRLPSENDAKIQAFTP